MERRRDWLELAASCTESFLQHFEPLSFAFLYFGHAIDPFFSIAGQQQIQLSRVDLFPCCIEVSINPFNRLVVILNDIKQMVFGCLRKHRITSQSENLEPGITSKPIKDFSGKQVVVLPW